MVVSLSALYTFVFHRDPPSTEAAVMVLSMRINLVGRSSCDLTLNMCLADLKAVDVMSTQVWVKSKRTSQPSRASRCGAPVGRMESGDDMVVTEFYLVLLAGSHISGNVIEVSLFRSGA